VATVTRRPCRSRYRRGDAPPLTTLSLVPPGCSGAKTRRAVAATCGGEIRNTRGDDRIARRPRPWVVIVITWHHFSPRIRVRKALRGCCGRSIEVKIRARQRLMGCRARCHRRGGIGRSTRCRQRASRLPRVVVDVAFRVGMRRRHGSPLAEVDRDRGNGSDESL